jgi:flagellar motor switch protein FliN
VAEKGAGDPPVWLPEELARQLTLVMEAMMGEAPYVRYVPHELTPAEVEAGEKAHLWWEQGLSLGPGMSIWIGAEPKSWEEIGNRILKSAGVEDGDPESIRSTYLEIVSQALSGVASKISARARQEVSCKDGHEAAPPASAEAVSYSFEIGVGDLTFPVIGVFSKTLADLPETPSAAEPPARVETAAPKTVEAEGGKSAIDLLLDVELPVSVSFGRAQLPLKDVIKLTTGSIVELNRAVSEPVDVIVNNCVIARGEVVVVEGNFGVRIRQVISRQERLRTLY